MTTFVPGPLRRPVVNEETLAPIVGADVRIVSFDGGLTFDADLDAVTVAAVCDWMTATDDEHQAKRATLRADRDALGEGDPLRRLYDYVLGD